MKNNLNRKGHPIREKEYVANREDNDSNPQKFVPFQPKPKRCEFCGTTEKSYNVEERMYDGKRYVFCDNPVCNYVPGNRKGDKR